MGVIYLAPKFIIHDNVDFRLSQKEWKDLEKLKLRHINDDNSIRLSVSSHAMNAKPFKRIKDYLNKLAEDYVKNVVQITNKIQHTQSWITVQEKGSRHQPHHHYNCMFSLVYYAHCPKSALIFTVPKNSLEEIFNYEYTRSQYNAINSNAWTVELKTGDVVFFTGDMNHETPFHKDHERRIVIGMNYVMDGKFGSQQAYSDVEVKTS